jgi:hypothetical protein
MGAAEVVSALGKYASVFVGSQELVPGHGWDYGALATLVTEPAATPVQARVHLPLGSVTGPVPREATGARAERAPRHSLECCETHLKLSRSFPQASTHV